MTAPLRIQVVSDLHCDVAPAQLRLAPDADVLVVAGDTCEGVERSSARLRATIAERARCLSQYFLGK